MWGRATTVREVRGVPVRVFEDRPRSLLHLLDVPEPDRSAPFLVRGGDAWTRVHLRAAAQATTAALVDAGVHLGDRVLLLAGSSPAWVAAFFGIVGAGATPVLGNAWWPADDVDHAVGLVAPRLVLADVARLPLVPAGVPVLDLAAIRPASGDSSTDRRVAAGGDEDGEGLVLFTSGTTARAKAALLSRRSVLANLQNLLDRTGQLPGVDEPRPAGVHLCTLPLFHMSGIQTVLLHLVTGGQLVFLDGRFDPGEVLRLVEEHRVTAWAAIPTMVSFVLAHPDLATRDTSSLASVAVGGASVPPDLRSRVEAAFPTTARRTGESYGSTEAGGTVATTTYDPVTKVAGPRPFANVEVRVLHPAADGSGELLVRSASLMEGYLSVAPDEQPIDADGWLHTGDLGRIDEHGVLSVTGRAKDLIIRGGENVAPAYVEAALAAHPDVVEVAVLGVPDPTWGEEVGAVVRLHAASSATEGALIEHAQGRLARFAVPTRWHLTADPLPLTDTGKVRRDDLRKVFTEGVPWTTT